MSTRSNIIVALADGRWKSVYAHWDGYLGHNGKILFEHYNSQERAEALVALGDISSLAPKCTKPKGHTFDKPRKGYTIYYGRDRGETDVDGTFADNLSAAWPPEDTWGEFVYVWKDGQWFVGDPDTGSQALMPLVEALAADARGENPIKSLVKTPLGAIARRA